MIDTTNILIGGITVLERVSLQVGETREIPDDGPHGYLLDGPVTVALLQAFDRLFGLDTLQKDVADGRGEIVVSLAQFERALTDVAAAEATSNEVAVDVPDLRYVLDYWRQVAPRVEFALWWNHPMHFIPVQALSMPDPQPVIFQPTHGGQ